MTRRRRQSRTAGRSADPVERIDSSPKSAAPVRVSRAAWILLLLAIAVGGALRVSAVSAKWLIYHDEAISYLLASCNKDEYGAANHERRAPYGTWVEAREWKQLLQPHEGVCFGQINDSLAAGDIHPPLYFWLLNLWSLMFGVHTWTGPALNVLVVTIACVALFFLARTVLRDSVAAGIVALLWCVSPAVIGSTLEARHYDLLALWTILFVAQLLRHTNAEAPRGRRPYVVLVAITSAGLLTHFHFGLIGLAGALLVAWRLMRWERRRLITVWGCLLAGCVVFVTLHPRFHESIPRARLQVSRNPRGPEQFQKRLDRVTTQYMSFGFDINGLDRAARPAARNIALGATVLAVLASLVPMVVRRFRRSRRVETRTDKWELYVLFFLVATAGTNIALYLTYQSPLHAMAPRYLSMVCPFLAFLPVMAARIVPGYGRVVLLGMMSVLFVFSGTQRVARYRRKFDKTVRVAPFLKGAKRAVINDVRAGVLPCLVWHFPDEMLVFAAKHEELLSNPDPWINELEDGDVFVHSTRVGQSRYGESVRVLVRRFKPHASGKPAADMGWIATLEER